MIAAVSTELFEPAFRQSGVWLSGAALLLGAGFYVVADRLIETRLGSAAIGWALLLGAVLDGIPESTALGVSLGPGTGIALLVAIAVGNVPEAIGGAALMPEAYREGGWWIGMATAAGFLVSFVLADRMDTPMRSSPRVAVSTPVEYAFARSRPPHGGKIDHSEQAGGRCGRNRCSAHRVSDATCAPDGRIPATRHAPADIPRRTRQ